MLSALLLHSLLKLRVDLATRQGFSRSYSQILVIVVSSDLPTLCPITNLVAGRKERQKEKRSIKQTTIGKLAKVLQTQ